MIIMLSINVCIEGALAGIPISFKDTVSIAGYDSTLGYTKFAFNPLKSDSTLVTILKEAGKTGFVRSDVQ